MDERGFFKIVDRKKDMILVSGFNVYPTELEDVVAQMEGVMECACVGCEKTGEADAKSGEAGACQAGDRPQAQNPAKYCVTEGLTMVRAFCKENLTGYKQPKRDRVSLPTWCWPCPTKDATTRWARSCGASCVDKSPLFPRFEVPLYGRARFNCHADLTSSLLVAAQDFVVHNQGHRHAGVATGVVVHRGLIASGDLFVGSAAQAHGLQQALQGAGHAPLAVEMEGAAVAQVCHDYGLPFAAVRTISDRADDQAHVDFRQFVQEVASHYAHGIVSGLLKSLSNQ
jgi:hypothetical protein